MKKGEGLDAPQTQGTAATDPTLCRATALSLSQLEKKLQISIPKNEANNICAFFSPDNCRQA